MRKTGTSFLTAFCALVVGAGGWIGSASAQTAPDIERMKERFAVVSRHLEPGGDLYLIADAHGLLEKTAGEILEAMSAAGADRADMKKAKALAARIHVFLKKNGFYGLDGVGLSMVPQTDGLNSLRFFVARAPETGTLPLWRACVGRAPRRAAALDFLPADTVAARTAVAELSEIWTLVQAGVRELAPAQGQAAFDTGVRELSATLGVEFERLMNSLSDEIFFALRLSVRETASIPIGDALHSIPVPSILLGVALKDDTLPDMIETLIAKQAAAGVALPILKTQEGDVTLHTLAMPLPLPVPFQPTWAKVSGFLLFGSTPETVKAALESARQKNGLVKAPAFTTAFAGLPWEQCNGILYMDKRLGKALADLQTASLAAAGSGSDPGMAPLLSLLQAMNKDRKAQSCALVVRNLKQGVLTQGRTSASGGELLLSTSVAPLGIVAGMTLPAIAAARERARRTADMSNIRQIGLASIMYSMDHDEAMPSRLADLQAYGISVPRQLVSPAGKTVPGAMDEADAWSDYVLVGGLKASDSAQAVLAFSKPEVHKGKGVNVLYLDGSVKWLDAGAWQRLSNTPAEFFGTADSARLTDLRGRVKLPPAYQRLLAH